MKNKLMVEMYRWQEDIQRYTNGVAFAVDQFNVQPADDGQWLMLTYCTDDAEITENILIGNEVKYRILPIECCGRYQGLITVDEAMAELHLNSITEIEEYSK